MHHRLRPYLFIHLILIFCVSSLARAEEDFLLPEQAFPVVAKAEGPKDLVLNWSVAEGYYLYRNKFKFRSLTEDIRIGEPRLPAGEKRHDEFFGEVEILRGQVAVRIPIEQAVGKGGRLSLETSSQGCADAGLCYPPHRQTLVVDIPPMERDAESVGKAKHQPSVNKSALSQSLGLSDPTGEQALLPAEEAFRLSAEVAGPDRLRLAWTIAEGTYLYRDKLTLGLEGPASVSIGSYELPPAEIVKNAVKPDGSLGDVALYRDHIDLELPLQRDEAGPTTITLLARFQGCADIGVCYPPRKVRIELALPPVPTASVTVESRGAVPTTLSKDEAKSERTLTGVSQEVTQQVPASDTSSQPKVTISEQDRIAAALASSNAWAALVLFFGFGLLLALTPCVFPMIPILSGIIAGHGPNLSTRKAFWMSLTYVLAMSLTYAIAGLLAGLGGANLQAAFQNPWILSLFALVFVALALSMFGFYELQLPSSLQSRIAALSQRQQGGHLIGVAIMGILSALIVGPCVAPPLAGALIFIGQTGDALLGFAALFSMGLGMGAPLLVIGTSAGKLLPRAGVWMEAVKAVFGVALLGVAILLLERLLEPSVAMLLWGALLICSGIYMGALHHLPTEASGWRKLWKGLGLVILVYGALMLVGAAAGGKDTLQPLRGIGFGIGAAANATPQANFKAISGLADLEREVAAAQASGRPVILDFYADWCVSCKEMERSTFSDPAVAAEMAHFVLLQADVTDNDAEDQALMQGRFGIPGPPAILFFDHQGQERRSQRLVGFMPASDFARHLRSLRP